MDRSSSNPIASQPPPSSPPPDPSNASSLPSPPGSIFLSPPRFSLPTGSADPTKLSFHLQSLERLKIERERAGIGQPSISSLGLEGSGTSGGGASGRGPGASGKGREGRRGGPPGGRGGGEEDGEGKSYHPHELKLPRRNTGSGNSSRKASPKGGKRGKKAITTTSTSKSATTIDEVRGNEEFVAPMSAEDLKEEEEGEDSGHDRNGDLGSARIEEKTSTEELIREEGDSSRKAEGSESGSRALPSTTEIPPPPSTKYPRPIPSSFYPKTAPATTPASLHPVPTTDNPSVISPSSTRSGEGLGLALGLEGIPSSSTLQPGTLVSQGQDPDDDDEGAEGPSTLITELAGHLRPASGEAHSENPSNFFKIPKRDDPTSSTSTSTLHPHRQKSHHHLHHHHHNHHHNHTSPQQQTLKRRLASAPFLSRVGGLSTHLNMNLNPNFSFTPIPSSGEVSGTSGQVSPNTGRLSENDDEGMVMISSLSSKRRLDPEPVPIPVHGKSASSLGIRVGTSPSNDRLSNSINTRAVSAGNVGALTGGGGEKSPGLGLTGLPNLGIGTTSKGSYALAARLPPPSGAGGSPSSSVSFSTLTPLSPFPPSSSSNMISTSSNPTNDYSRHGPNRAFPQSAPSKPAPLAPPPPPHPPHHPSRYPSDDESTTTFQGMGRERGMQKSVLPANMGHAVGNAVKHRGSLPPGLLLQHGNNEEMKSMLRSSSDSNAEGKQQYPTSPTNPPQHPPQRPSPITRPGLPRQHTSPISPTNFSFTPMRNDSSSSSHKGEYTHSPIDHPQPSTTDYFPETNDNHLSQPNLPPLPSVSPSIPGAKSAMTVGRRVRSRNPTRVRRTVMSGLMVDLETVAAGGFGKSSNDHNTNTGYGHGYGNGMDIGGVIVAGDRMTRRGGTQPRQQQVGPVGSGIGDSLDGTEKGVWMTPTTEEWRAFSESLRNILPQLSATAASEAEGRNRLPSRSPSSSSSSESESSVSSTDDEASSSSSSSGPRTPELETIPDQTTGVTLPSAPPSKGGVKTVGLGLALQDVNVKQEQRTVKRAPPLLTRTPSPRPPSPPSVMIPSPPRSASPLPPKRPAPAQRPSHNSLPSLSGQSLQSSKRFDPNSVLSGGGAFPGLTAPAPLSGHSFGSPVPPPAPLKAPLVDTRSPIDPRMYSAVTGARNIDDFVVEGEAGKGAYGLVRRAREKGEDGQPTGPEVIIKYIIKQRILADCWKRHKVLGAIPVEIHVLDHIRRIPYTFPSWSSSSTPLTASPSGLKGIPPSRKGSTIFTNGQTPSLPEMQPITGHSSICPILDFFEDSEFYYLIMPLTGKGQDLFDYVDIYPDGLPLNEVKNIFGQISDAVRWLHSIGIVHRDIKDENVVLDGEGGTAGVRLIDFGSAAYIREGRKFDTFSGTLDFAAPEVLKGERYGGRETDVWALGVLLYVLVIGECPFYAAPEAQIGIAPGSRPEQALHSKQKGGGTDSGVGVEGNDSFSEMEGGDDGSGRATDAVDLIKRCLEVNPDDRPTTDQITGHVFLRGTKGGWKGHQGWMMDAVPPT